MNEIITSDYGNLLNMLGKVAHSHFLRDNEVEGTKQVWMVHKDQPFHTVFYFDRQENFLGTSLEVE